MNKMSLSNLHRNIMGSLKNEMRLKKTNINSINMQDQEIFASKLD